MQRLVYFLIGLFLYCQLPAQETRRISDRVISVSAKDSLLKIPETVKVQLNKLIGTKQQPAPLRLLLTAADFAAKNNTARWLAARQQKNLLTVNLAAVISKYAGETEKNLEKIFSKAEEAGCVLLFDEADALFGSRTNTGSSVAVDYFMEKAVLFKGSILLNCTGENCSSLLLKKNFIKLSGTE